jgi:hypothetical protein
MTIDAPRELAYHDIVPIAEKGGRNMTDFSDAAFEGFA